MIFYAESINIIYASAFMCPKIKESTEQRSYITDSLYPIYFYQPWPATQLQLSILLFLIRNLRTVNVWYLRSTEMLHLWKNRMTLEGLVLVCEDLCYMDMFLSSIFPTHWVNCDSSLNCKYCASWWVLTSLQFLLNCLQTLFIYIFFFFLVISTLSF